MHLHALVLILGREMACMHISTCIRIFGNMRVHTQVIGRGAFGEVRLCRSKADPDQLYAIKVLKKKEMQQKDQVVK